MSLSDSNISLKFLLALSIVLTIQACGGGSSGPNYDDVPPPYNKSEAVKDSTTSDGLQIYVIKKGDGAFETISRDQIQVRYTGRTKSGTIFESSYRNGNTGSVTFQNLTTGTVRNQFGQPISPLIDGFRRGLLGMVEGEKRKIVIPPALGYQGVSRGSQGYKFRNDTLVFDVELTEIL